MFLRDRGDVVSPKGSIRTFKHLIIFFIKYIKMIQLQNRLEIKNNSLDEREEGKIRGSFSD